MCVARSDPRERLNPPYPPFSKGGTVFLPLGKRGTEGDFSSPLSILMRTNLSWPMDRFHVIFSQQTDFEMLNQTLKRLYAHKDDTARPQASEHPFAHQRQ